MARTKNGRGHLKNDHGKLSNSLRRVDKMAEANLNLASAIFQNNTIWNFYISRIKYGFVLGKIFSVIYIPKPFADFDLSVWFCRGVCPEVRRDPSHIP